jgi:hypothetical protein
LDVRLSAWVPPGVRVNALVRDGGGEVRKEGGTRRIMWSREAGIVLISVGGRMRSGWEGSGRGFL